MINNLKTTLTHKDNSSRVKFQIIPFQSKLMVNFYVIYEPHLKSDEVFPTYDILWLSTKINDPDPIPDKWLRMNYSSWLGFRSWHNSSTCNKMKFYITPGRAENEGRNLLRWVWWDTYLVTLSTSTLLLYCQTLYVHSSKKREFDAAYLFPSQGKSIYYDLGCQASFWQVAVVVNMNTFSLYTFSGGAQSIN